MVNQLKSDDEEIQGDEVVWASLSVFFFVCVCGAAVSVEVLMLQKWISSSRTLLCHDQHTVEMRHFVVAYYKKA